MCVKRVSYKPNTKSENIRFFAKNKCDKIAVS